MTYLPLRVDAGGNGRVVLWDASGNPLLGTAQAAGEAIANPTLGGVLAFSHLFDGTNWHRSWTLDGNADDISPGYRGAVTVPLPRVFHEAGNNWDRTRSYESISGRSPAGTQAVGNALVQHGTNTMYPITGSQADGGKIPGANGMNVVPRQYVANDDFMAIRGNTTPAVILASAVRTTSTSTAIQLNPNAPGLTIFLAVSARPGDLTETLAIGIDTTYDAGASWVGMMYFGATAFGGGTGVYLVQVHPGAADNFTHHYQATAQFAVPFWYRVTILHSAGGSWTYSVFSAMHAN